MKVGKILNNNVVVVFENGKTEKIAMGRGIAFGKKVGDSIDEEKCPRKRMGKILVGYGWNDYNENRNE